MEGCVNCGDRLCYRSPRSLLYCLSFHVLTAGHILRKQLKFDWLTDSMHRIFVIQMKLHKKMLTHPSSQVTMCCWSDCWTLTKQATSMCWRLLQHRCYLLRVDSARLLHITFSCMFVVFCALHFCIKCVRDVLNCYSLLIWYCWLVSRKGIHLWKSWVLVCWWWCLDWSWVRMISTRVKIIPSYYRIER